MEEQGSLRLNGLTEFQRDLLKIAKRQLPNESKKIMQKIGNKARAHVTKKSRSIIKKKTGNYQKGWKRGKVFRGYNGEFVVRVINSSPHAHLIEDGHIQLTKDGRDTGRFIHGKKVLEKGMRDFENSGEFEQMLSKWLDGLLEKGNL